MTRTASEWLLGHGDIWYRDALGFDAANVERTGGDVERWEAGVDRGRVWQVVGFYPTADAAKAAAYARLTELGWVLL